MPRTKTPVGFIENARKRRSTFKRRRATLLDKAEQLATLCAVPVGVVVFPAEAGDGGAPPTVWEKPAGVLDRYRALPDREHTHLRYLEDVIAKEKVTLARLRQDGPRALQPPHAAMGMMTLDQLRGMRLSVEAVMAAAADRRRQLGLPVDDNTVGAPAPARDSGPWTVEEGSGSDGGCLYMTQQGQGGGDTDHGLLDQDQPMIWQGDGGGMIPPGLYNGMNMPDAVHLGGYQGPPMTGYVAPDDFIQPHDAITQPWNDYFEYDDGTSSSWMQLLSNYNNGAVHDLPIAGYHYMYTSGNPLAAAENPGLFTGNNFTSSPAEFLGVGDSGNGGNPPAAENPGQFTAVNNFTGAPAVFLDVGASGNGTNYQNAYDSLLFGNSTHNN